MATTETLAKLNRILDGLMGVKLGLQFQSIDELSIDQWKSGDLKILKEKSELAPQYILDGTGTTLGFPVNLQGNFAGLAVVNNWDGARPRQLMLLAELVTSLLERGLSESDRREKLRTLEERMLLETNKPKNVIALRPARFGKVLELTEPDLLSEPLKPSPLTSRPLLIETKADFPLHRIAVEIHQMSERWALVNLSDLPADILDSREGLQELGAVSLFIKNLESLSIEQQIKLAEYLATKPGTDMPHIIAGITELEEGVESKILPHLLDQFCHSQLNFTDRSPEEITRTFIAASLELMLETSRENLKAGQFYMPFHIRHLDPNHPTMH
jgi:hypothetical protein